MHYQLVVIVLSYVFQVLGLKFQDAAYSFMFHWNPPIYSKLYVLKALMVTALVYGLCRYVGEFEVLQ